MPLTSQDIGADPKLFEHLGVIGRFNFIHNRILNFDENLLYGSIGPNFNYSLNNMVIVTRYRLFGIYNQPITDYFMNVIPKFEYGAEIGYILPNDGFSFGVQLSNIRLAINAKAAF